MAVGDIDGVHGVKAGADFGDGIFVVDDPESVLYTVVGGDIDQWLGFSDVRQNRIHVRLRFVGQQHRAGLSVQRFDLAHTIIFLGRTGVFMFTDAVGIVIGDRGGSDQANL